MLGATLISLSAWSAVPIFKNCKDTSVSGCISDGSAYAECGQSSGGTYNPKCVGLIAIEQVGNGFVYAEGVSKPFLNLDKACNYTTEDAEWRKVVEWNYAMFTKNDAFVKGSISEKCWQTIFERACPSTNVESYDFQNLHSCSVNFVRGVLYPYGIDRKYNGKPSWGSTENNGGVTSSDYSSSVVGELQECTKKAFKAGVDYASYPTDTGNKLTTLSQRQAKAQQTYLECAEQEGAYVTEEEMKEGETPTYRPYWGGQGADGSSDSVKSYVDCLEMQKYQNYDDVVLNCVNDVDYPDAVQTIFDSALANIEKFVLPGAVTVNENACVFEYDKDDGWNTPTNCNIVNCPKEKIDDEEEVPPECEVTFQSDGTLDGTVKVKDDLTNRASILKDLQTYVDEQNKASADPMVTQIKANQDRIWQTTTTTTTTTVVAAAGFTSSMLSMAVFVTLSMLLIL